MSPPRAAPLLVLLACRAAAPTEDTALLLSLGYLEGSQPPPTPATGVTLHDPRAAAGTNLIASAHERVIRELDLDGVELRRWTLPAEATQAHDPTGFRRVAPLADGGVVAILEGRALVRFDASGHLVWRTDAWVHHDVHPLPDGGFLTLTRTTRAIPELSAGGAFVDDRVSWFDADGRPTRHLSVLSALQASRWWGLAVQARADRRDAKQRDLLHTNAVQLLDGTASDRNPRFAAGNLLVTMNYLDAAGVIDPAAGAFVWMLAGKGVVHPHDAELLPDGRLQIFDNSGGHPWSGVRWFDVARGDLRQSWMGSPEWPFHTRNCGGAQLLPNGNLLLIEANAGRAIELSPDRTPVWEWRSPFRVSGEPALVANLNDLVRVPSVTAP
jgi:hypothetical protein